MCCIPAFPLHDLFLICHVCSFAGLVGTNKSMAPIHQSAQPPPPTLTPTSVPSPFCIIDVLDAPVIAGTQIADVLLDMETAGVRTVKGFATIDDVALINVEVGFCMKIAAAYIKSQSNNKLCC